MKIKDIAKQNGFNEDDFEEFIYRKKYYVFGFVSMSINDDDVENAVAAYKNELEDREKGKAKMQEEAIRKQKALEEKNKALASMLVTSGFSFDGYTIKRYSGYISGDDVVSVNRDALFAAGGQNLTDALVKIRIQALKELKEAAYDLGCNAVIGVDFDYMTFEPETISGNIHYYQPYVICVTANGNAVVIEKN